MDRVPVPGGEHGLARQAREIPQHDARILEGTPVSELQGFLAGGQDGDPTAEELLLEGRSSGHADVEAQGLEQPQVTEARLAERLLARALASRAGRGHVLPTPPGVHKGEARGYQLRFSLPRTGTPPSEPLWRRPPSGARGLHPAGAEGRLAALLARDDGDGVARHPRRGEGGPPVGRSEERRVGKEGR